MHILWCITGAGYFLKETADIMSNLSKEHKISVCLSHFGNDVIRTYGLSDTIKEISSHIHSNIAYSSSITKKLCLKEYDIVIIAPCTTNSVAKMVYGIADTLVTNIFSDALKNRITTLVLPTDQEKKIDITIPSDGSSATIFAKKIDLENVEKLRRMDDVIVLKSPRQILESTH